MHSSGSPIPLLASTFPLLPFFPLPLSNESFSVSLVLLKMVTLFFPLDYQEVGSSAVWWALLMPLSPGEGGTVAAR